MDHQVNSSVEKLLLNTVIVPLLVELCTHTKLLKQGPDNNENVDEFGPLGERNHLILQRFFSRQPVFMTRMFNCILMADDDTGDNRKAKLGTATAIFYLIKELLKYATGTSENGMNGIADNQSCFKQLKNKTLILKLIQGMVKPLLSGVLAHHKVIGR